MKDLSISTKITLTVSIILVFVIVIGIVAYGQTSMLHEQTETMYNHPLRVRRAIDLLNSDVLTIRLYMNEFTTINSDKEKQIAIQHIELAAVDAEQQLKIIEEQYLGEKEDVEAVFKGYALWNIAIQKNIELVFAGNEEEARKNMKEGGSVASYTKSLTASIEKIDEFAQNKADTLYETSVKLSRTLNAQLIFIVGAIIVISMFLIYAITRSVRKPLSEMNDTVLRFHKGDLDARIGYKSKNELGVLAYSINKLTDLVKINTILSHRTESFADVMLRETNDKEFFNSTLGLLAEYTGAQMACAYLLNDDSNNYEYFASIGMDSSIKESFSADKYEGEFGTAINSRKIQHISDISNKTTFMFHSVNGKYIPREIITIPILSENKVIAIISLYTINNFDSKSVDFVDKVVDTMSARISGIIAYRSIKEIKDVLEKQNQELDQQKNELSMQTKKLSRQNIELEMQKNQLNEASRLKTSFLSNMSHELRTPLNSVIALSGVLSRSLYNKIDADEYSYLEIIERNGRNLLSLINDVLDISRIETGKEEIKASKFSINNLVLDITTMLKGLADQKNIELTCDIKDNELFISSDIDKCRHIVQNLISNAIKFTDKGSVKISVLKVEDKIQVSVEDTGIGISKQHLPYIFDEFRQGDSSVSKKYGGTGLGLAIAKKYANIIGGNISVESYLDKGSKFILTLPLDMDDINDKVQVDAEVEPYLADFEDDKSKATGKPSDKKKPLVLIVEDNTDNMVTIKALLKDDYMVIEADDGIKSVEIVQEKIPDLILMDIALPGINGVDAFKKIRNNLKSRHIPIIALTASAMDHDREVILAHGFDAFIAKPIFDEQFFKVINEVLYER